MLRLFTKCPARSSSTMMHIAAFLAVSALTASAENFRGTSETNAAAVPKTASSTAPRPDLKDMLQTVESAKGLIVKPLSCPIGIEWDYTTSPASMGAFSLDMAILPDGSRRCFSGPYAQRQYWEKPPLSGTLYGQDDVVGTFYMSFPTCGTPSANSYCNESEGTSDITEHDRGQGYLGVNWGKFYQNNQFYMNTLPWDNTKKALYTNMQSVDNSRYTNVWIYCSGAADSVSANFQCYGSSCYIQVYVGVASGTLCDAEAK